MSTLIQAVNDFVQKGNVLSSGSFDSFAYVDRCTRLTSATMDLLCDITKLEDGMFGERFAWIELYLLAVEDLIPVNTVAAETIMIPHTFDPFTEMLCYLGELNKQAADSLMDNHDNAIMLECTNNIRQTLIELHTNYGVKITDAIASLLEQLYPEE